MNARTRRRREFPLFFLASLRLCAFAFIDDKFIRRQPQHVLADVTRLEEAPQAFSIIWVRIMAMPIVAYYRGSTDPGLGSGRSWQDSVADATALALRQFRRARL